MRYSTQKKIRRYLAIALAGMLGIVACVYYAIPYHLLYDGDGAFTDRGVLAHEKRFEIDLGAIDIARAGRYSYTLRRMPQAHFVAGVMLAEALPAIPPNGSPDAGRVALTITGPSGKLVDERSSLGDWSRSGGLRHVDPTGSGAPGTTFTTERLENYTVTFEVVVPFPATIGAKLALQSD